MPVRTIKSYKEFMTVIEGKKPIVVDFWATWCGPCKVISPVFERLSDLPENKEIGFYKVDVDEQQEVALEAKIRAMPTFIYFKDGDKKLEVVGANPAALEALIVEARKTLILQTFV
ncbi:putative TRX2-thioredoxin II [Lyophyllum atratum]|nr:putative TRX2-thioredoxin II [Lyophyllum atratum]